MVGGDSPSPSSFRVAWRLACGVFLLGLWVTGPGYAGLLLTLALAGMGVARWRFRLPGWTTLLDQALCLAILPLWPGAGFALCLAVFDSCAEAEPWWAAPGLVAFSFLGRWSLGLAALLAAAFSCGIATALWERQAARVRREADSERGERLEAERIRGEMLFDSLRAARIAELAERARIARDLHDHAGHEIIAAQLGLDAFAQLWREDDPRAADMLARSQARLQEGMGILRATVRGLAPGAATGIAGLEEVCRSFAGPAVRLAAGGDTDAVPAHAWAVLEPCLKEALSNAARHGERGGIEVSVDVGPHVVRLCVASRGSGTSAGPPGFGLRSLQHRARAVGGSVSTDTRDGFRLICVLPLAAPGETAPRAGQADGRQP